ncbi:MAG: hypothetical protein KDK66_05245, partial [Deltaproteobacteria bacterium]|nr:hypothetical protein [Deltaproteobacteria bacterium]
MSQKDDENLLKELEDLGGLEEELPSEEPISQNLEGLEVSSSPSPQPNQSLLIETESHQSFLLKKAGGGSSYRRLWKPEYSARHRELGEVWFKDLAKLCHPNLISLSDYGEEEACFWIQRPWVEGKPLFQALQETSESQKKLFWISQLFLVWDYLASLGRGHGALTPENLWVDSEGKLKVTDPMLALFSEGTTKEEAWSKQVGLGLGGLEKTFAQDRFCVATWLLLALGAPPLSPSQTLAKLTSLRLGNKVEGFLKKFLDPQGELFPRDFTQAFFKLFPQEASPSLPPQLEDLTQNLEWVRLFRQLMLSGQTWALDCSSADLRFVLGAWIKRYFALNQKPLLC